MKLPFNNFTILHAKQVAETNCKSLYFNVKSSLLFLLNATDRCRVTDEKLGAPTKGAAALVKHKEEASLGSLNSGIQALIILHLSRF